MEQYAFSLNGENWSGAFDTRDAALKAAIQKCLNAADPPGTVYVGEISPEGIHADRLGKRVIDEMRSRANNAEGSRHLHSITAAQLTELDAAIERVVIAWLQKHEFTPQSLRMEAVSEHLTPVPHRGLGLANGDGKEVQDLGVGEFPG